MFTQDNSEFDSEEIRAQANEIALKISEREGIELNEVTNLFWNEIISELNK